MSAKVFDEFLCPSRCERCGSFSRIAFHEKRWLCAACHPPMACPRCGTLCAAVDVGRLGVLQAESNARYATDQAVGFRCHSDAHPGHLFFGPTHKGPGALLWEAKR
jgi:ribosomal protein S27AE